MTEKTRVTATVCIPTFRRPETLVRLLSALRSLAFPSFQSAPPQWDVLVIDNDPQGSAKEEVEAQQKDFPVPLYYEVEPQIGLCHSRNHAIRFTRDHADFLCFIDDDEEPVTTWLDELLAMQAREQARCVYGPVLARLPPQAPGWLVRGGYLNTPPFQNGQRLPWAGTGNVLISTAFLRETGLLFDPRFNHLGGEDTHFFNLAQRRYNLEIIGCLPALAYEAVPAERLTLLWLLKRRFRMGGSLTISEGDQKLRLALRAFKGLGWCLLGVALIFSALWRGKDLLIDGLVKVAFGVGMIGGMVGVTHLEYAPSADC